MIKAARSYSLPPTVLILKDRQPQDGWLPVDKKLAIALQILEDETCPDCGIPMWIGHSEDESVVFDIKSRVCYACAEIESKQEQEEKRRAKSKTRHRETKGKKRFIVRDEAKPAPSRDSYLRREAGIIE